MQTFIEGFCQCDAHLQHFHFFIQKTCGGAGNVHYSNKSIGHQEPAYLARCFQLSTRILRFSGCALLHLTKAEIKKRDVEPTLGLECKWTLDSHFLKSEASTTNKRRPALIPEWSVDRKCVFTPNWTFKHASFSNTQYQKKKRKGGKIKTPGKLPLSLRDP